MSGGPSATPVGHPSPPPDHSTVDITVIVPTRNEAPNIGLLVRRLSDALGDRLAPSMTWELLFVDDSDDDTADAVADQATAGYPVRLLHRPAGRRPGGLGGAVQDGFAAASGQIIAVMDADLQHPPEIMPDVLAPIMDGRADLVSGTRYAGAGETSGLAGPWRRLVSAGARWLVHGVLPQSRRLTDPLSGLFAFDRAGIAGVALQANGFKILLEVVARGRWQGVENVEYRFDRRHAGRSKASLREGWLFAQHLVALARASRIPEGRILSDQRVSAGAPR